MRIFFDEAWLPPGAEPVVALYPFLRPEGEDDDGPTASRYDRWLAHGREVLERVSLEDAEAAIFPAKWEHVAGRPDAEQVAAAAAAGGRQRPAFPLAVFFWSDSTEPVELPGAVVFRTSLTRSGRRTGEHAMPAWSEDLVDVHLGGSLPNGRGASGRRSASAASPGRRRFVRAWRDSLRGPSPHAARDRALRLLEASPAVDTNIVLRPSFYGGAAGGEPDAQLQARTGYVENLVASDYVLCARGAGNFSYRLYETLSCGRIPVFVDTDCVLPHEESIDWHSLCVWVDESELDEIGERVAAFHASHDDRSFRELQQECRRVWLDRLSPEGWFGHLDRYFAR